MVYLVCAIYPEAKSYIELLGLKRENGYSSYQVYSNLEYTLILTGQGKVCASIALTDYFATHTVAMGDLLILIGCAGGFTEESKLFVVSSITDTDTGFIFYPDILFSHNLPEAALLTCSSVVNSDTLSRYEDYLGSPNILFDMEASGVYQAAIRFFTCDRIILLKFTSDNVKTNELLQSFTNLFENEVLTLISDIKNKYIVNSEKNNIQAAIDKLVLYLNASEAMTHEIERLINYLATLDIDLDSFLYTFYEKEGLLEPVNRRLGKAKLETLKNTILEL